MPIPTPNPIFPLESIPPAGALACDVEEAAEVVEVEGVGVEVTWGLAVVDSVEEGPLEEDVADADDSEDVNDEGEAEPTDVVPAEGGSIARTPIEGFAWPSRK